jgi:peroxiredoxin
MVWVDSQEEEPLVRSYMGRQNVTFTVLLDDDGQVARRYRAYSIPTVLFIDREGIIQGRYLSVMTEEKIAKSLEAIGVDP